MAQSIEHIAGTITADLDDDGLRAVCDRLNNWAAGDADADRSALVAALTDTVTGTVGQQPWGGCSADVTDVDGTVSVTFPDDAPAGVVELCELLAPWFSGRVEIGSEDGLSCTVLADGQVTVDSDPSLVASGDSLWLAQFIYLDGSTFVHICRSREDAYLALARQEDLEIAERQTAEEAVVDQYADSAMTSYNVAPVDSINL